MFNPGKMKLKVNVGGVSKDIPQGELTRIVLGQDENGEDILGGYYTDYNEDMTPDLTTYEASIKVQEDYLLEKNKEEALSNMRVTLKADRHLVFYADKESRLDITDAILNSKAGDSTLWKLAEAYEGKRIIEVTHEELREASKLALKAKGYLVGVNNV